MITEREQAIVDWKLAQGDSGETAADWLQRNINTVGEAQAVQWFKVKAARWAADYDSAA